VRDFTLAFIIAGGNACKASWFNAYDPRTGWQLPEITTLRQAGGDVKISFGGQAGMELGQACTDVNALTAEYQAVVTAYRLKYIDFDIEGAAVAEPGSIDRRSKAIKKLEAANPGLKVSLTLPVLPSGLDANGLAVVRSAKANGVKLDVVNVMAMDYGGGFSGDSGTLAANAATATRNQLKSVFAGLSDAAAFRMIGITPMLGQNDDGRKFTVANASALVGYARANHVGELSFWEVTRDRNACTGALFKCTNVPQKTFEFSKIFAGYTG
jgi:chitinase